MPPKIKTTKENIIDAAFSITREEGADKLNARSLAARLGCSVQPIFRAFRSMDDVKAAVFQRVVDFYQEFLISRVSMEDALVGLEMAYIQFAREEKHLFKLLHMSDRMELEDMSDFADVGINKQVVEVMAAMMKLPIEQAKELYKGTFFAAHGIASIIATNHGEFDNEEIQKIMDNVFYGLVMRIQSQNSQKD